MNVLSLFTGIGGLDLGVKLACPEARVVCAVEADGYCQRVLAARMRDGSLDPCPIHGDITTFDGRPWRGCVDLVAGGFPCQDISNAGRREGIDGAKSGLWHEMLRVVCEARPRFVFVENVSALLVRGLDTVLGGLAEIGLDAEWTLLGADDVGAPHRRKRVFILGYSDEQYDDVRGSDPGEVLRRRGAPTELRGGMCALADAAGSGDGPLPGGAPGDAGENGGRTTGSEQLEGGFGAVVNAPRVAEREPDDAPRSLARKRAWEDAGGGLPIFPPGPGERERWEAILRDHPGLAPTVECGVRCVANGSTAGVGVSRPYRVDQLRALGNSVCPQTAALALLILMRRISE